ncbi:hypothetical protein R3I94_013638 [Phoxinus phoxinus]
MRQRARWENGVVIRSRLRCLISRLVGSRHQAQMFGTGWSRMHL